MVVVSGFAGSGKTETGKMLAELTSWAVLDKDTMSRPFVESLLLRLTGDPHDRQSDVYLREVRPIEYQCLLKTGYENLQYGASSILSAPFIREVNDDQWLRRAHKQCVALAGRLIIVWVAADVETMRLRLIARNAERDSWKIANWEQYADSIDATMVPSSEHFLLDNSIDSAAPLADQVRGLATALDNR
jgi:predicted kinase